MAGVTLAQAQAQLDNWLAAEAAVAQRGQSYSINGRSLNRADLGEISERVSYWDGQVKRLTSVATGRRGPRYIVVE